MAYWSTRGAVAAAAIGVGLGAYAATASSSAAQENRGFGAYASHRLDEFYDLEMDLQPSGRPGLPKRFKESRIVIKVPAHYGALTATVQTGPDALLWFRADDGTLRNVVVADAATTPYALVRAESFRLEEKSR